MPIYLNLLAEAQAEEELRRRDPVKRAIWAAGFLVCCVLLYSGLLLTQTLYKRSELHKLETALQSQSTQYQRITDNAKKLTDLNQKLAYLRQLASNRFLWGNALNALQTSTVENVQLTHLRAEQTYVVTEAIKPKSDDGNGISSPGKPGYVTQKIVLFVDAKDTSSNPGDQISKYKNSLTSAPFFGKTSTNNSGITIKLKNLSAPMLDSESGRQAMMFSFECVLPDKQIK